jgi:hypothetical protein
LYNTFLNYLKSGSTAPYNCNLQLVAKLPIYFFSFAQPGQLVDYPALEPANPGCRTNSILSLVFLFF